ncbi:PilZ domain-containing protein [Halomonas sp. M5N1S17]|uniref:PilZ domain-containing protein n=1 Tax=Halomonas alkalisoli TaxID=2907158 RepID=UPI001F38D69D|nr:HD domain-containing phosphohydrolase [Halomonas alkalisoli]MCE9662817.1 PilZ domain-containing protein [Halomonas alkalisoli]
MTTASRSENPTAQVIRSLLQHKHQLSVFSKIAPFALPAEVAELDLNAGQLVLEAEYSGSDIEQYISNGCLNFDLEAMKSPDTGEREVYSISNVVARVLKTDSTSYRLECQLPESVFIQESRGSIRIPFILGMHARVSVEVYLHELSISGRLRNLSVGGCMIDIDIADSVAISVEQALPGITLEFPNGASFFAEVCVRHMRPFGNHGHAAVGFQFINLTTLQSEALFHYVSEVEREAAYRAGVNDTIASHSPLFIPGAKEKKILQREDQERQKRAHQPPVQRGVLEIANQLQVGLMYMKTRDLFPEEVLYDCADTLLYLVTQDRKALLYALAFLRNEPDWVRHAVQVAGQLADMMLLRDPHSPQVREAVLGALLHNMGKPLLVSEELPSLKAHMKPYQKSILKGHVATLLSKLQALGWSPSPICRDVLENTNERLDGSGYPGSKRDKQLSELARLVSVIKVINKLTHERNGIPARAPLDAYRWVNDVPEAFDKTVLVEYIQTYGLYPIGSLSKFSGGFLAWIIDIDAKGMPQKVHVIKNLAFKDTNIDSVLTTKDFSQIGKLEGVVNPAEYGIMFVK